MNEPTAAGDAYFLLLVLVYIRPALVTSRHKVFAILGLNLGNVVSFVFTAVHGFDVYDVLSTIWTVFVELPPAKGAVYRAELVVAAQSGDLCAQIIETHGTFLPLLREHHCFGLLLAFVCRKLLA